MGILNVTPDSFSEPGRWSGEEEMPSAVCATRVSDALEMVAAGATIIDIGGESTRPGSTPVGVDEELARVIPVITQLAQRTHRPISIDTSKPEVMRAAVAAGAGLINDVWALRRPGALESAAELGVPVCLMHMQGEPGTMQHTPRYRDVVAEVADFFAHRIATCEAAGLPRQRLLLDPGFGFGKTLEHNLQLLHNLELFTHFGLPLLVGLSRKSMIGALLNGAAVEQRLYGSIAAALSAVQHGATILRVHDVRPSVEALTIYCALKGDLRR